MVRSLHGDGTSVTGRVATEAAGQGLGFGTSVFGKGVPPLGEFTASSCQHMFAKRVALSCIKQANGLDAVSPPKMTVRCVEALLTVCWLTRKESNSK